MGSLAVCNARARGVQSSDRKSEDGESRVKDSCSSSPAPAVSNFCYAERGSSRGYHFGKTWADGDEQRSCVKFHSWSLNGSASKSGKREQTWVAATTPRSSLRSLLSKEYPNGHCGADP